jgi:hypothetical protein
LPVDNEALYRWTADTIAARSLGRAGLLKDLDNYKAAAIAASNATFLPADFVATLESFSGYSSANHNAADNVLNTLLQVLKGEIDGDVLLGLGQHNYCRNPIAAPGGAWCFVDESAVAHDDHIS